MPHARPTVRFSIVWFMTFTILNLVGTAFLGVMAFGTAMSAFSVSSNTVKGNLMMLELLAWIWTTGTMVASKCFGMTVENGVFGITILWAIIVGLIAGFVMPRLLERMKNHQSTCIDAPPPEKW